MPVVDFHSHFFSHTYFETLAAQSPRPGTPAEKLAALAQATGIEIPRAGLAEHLERWLREMDRHEVEHLCSFGSVPEETPVVVEAAALARGRLSAFALVNPRAEGAAERMQALLAAGRIRGCLVFPALHHYRIDGPEAAPLLRVLEQQRSIVYVHCGLLVVKVRDLLGLPRVQDLRHADPLHVIPAANAHPSVRFVIPHFGAGFLRETLFAGASCPNVFVDSSSSNSWMRTQAPRLELREVFERALEVFGPQRILFGTDSNTFPAGWRRERWDEQIAVLQGLGASAADQELFARGNARRLLGLA